MELLVKLKNKFSMTYKKIYLLLTYKKLYILILIN